MGQAQFPDIDWTASNYSNLAKTIKQRQEHGNEFWEASLPVLVIPYHSGGGAALHGRRGLFHLLVVDPVSLLLLGLLFHPLLALVGRNPVVGLVRRSAGTGWLVRWCAGARALEGWCA